MKLLSIGLEILRRYENKLSRKELISAQDLRLATWAVETTYRQQHHTPVRHHILSTLNALRIHTGDFESDTSNASKVHTTLAILNDHLAEVVNDPVPLPVSIDLGETLRIPKTILTRLRDENGRPEPD
jgi:hypothetical protein